MNKLIYLFATVLVLAGCGTNDDSSSDIPKVVIKGTLSDVGQKKSDQVLSLSDARKVLVFNSSGYNLFSISNNSFTAEAAMGTATALAFLDNDNRYIGCLSAGGLNVLPLVSLKDGDNTVIDLSTLTLEGITVLPANNPIGNEINLNEDEVARYKALGTYYEALSKNIDADNDGVPDLLSKREFNISTVFDICCGMWGLNDSPPVVNDASSVFINYSMRITGAKSLIPANQTIKVSGPEGAPHNDIKQDGYTVAPDCFISFFNRQAPSPSGSPFGSAFLPFMAGKYTVTLDAKDYTLHYSNINADFFLILAKPTIRTNSNNQVVSISVEYTDRNQVPVISENFVYQTMVQFTRKQSTLVNQIGALWESPEAKTNTELYHFVLSEPIPLSELDHVTVCYLDLIGNAYNIRWRHNNLR